MYLVLGAPRLVDRVHCVEDLSTVNVSVRNEVAAKEIIFYMLLSCLCVVDA